MERPDIFIFNLRSNRLIKKLKTLDSSKLEKASKNQIEQIN